MADRKKPTRRKRVSRKEAKTAAEHAGAERSGGTAQHSSQSRPSVKDSRHGVRRRRVGGAVKESSAQAKQNAETKVSPSHDEPVSGESAEADAKRAPVGQEHSENRESSSYESRGSKRTAAPVRATAPAIETQIPSIASDFPASSADSDKVAADASAGEGLSHASDSTGSADASAESSGDPLSFVPSSPSSASSAGDASMGAGASNAAVASTKAEGASPSGSNAQVPAASASDGTDASTSSSATAAAASATSTDKSRPSFAGKRATGPDIVDHVKERARRKRKRRKVLAVVLVIVAIAAVVGGLFAWQRWFRYDDTADIQGTWQLEANKKQGVVIDSTHIDLMKGLAYTYSLDTWGKTISFTFNNETGTGSYHFNDDRTVLVIREGGDEPNILVQLGLQEDPAIQDDTLKDSVTVLTKVSDDTEAEYKGQKIRITSKSKKSSSSDSSSTSTESDSSDATDSTAASDESSASEDSNTESDGSSADSSSAGTDGSSASSNG